MTLPTFLLLLGTAAPPHLIYVLTDDLGWNYPGYHNDEVITPTLDALAAGGVRLESHYMYKYCSPSRGSLMTGRYPWNLVSARCNLIPSSIPEGVHLDYEMLPKTLAKRGYTSHHIGKWHLGFHTSAYTPVARGFNTSFGFLEGGEDHFTHWCGAGQVSCGVDGNKKGAYDLWNQSMSFFPGAPVPSLIPAKDNPMDDATFSGYIFTRRAVEVVEAHDTAAGPLFMYLALHDTHAPLQAPQRFLDIYESRFGVGTRKTTLSAMVSVVDETVANLTAAIKAKPGMWSNTLLVWTTDNGSPVNAGGSNYPLKGGKGSNWEGGTRVPTFIAGGVLPKEMAGKILDGLVSVADWYATFAGLAGLEAVAPAAGPATPQSINQWPYFSGAVDAPPRTELVHDHHMFTNESALGGLCGGQVPMSLPGYSALGALRQGDWKLIVGVEFQASWYGKFSPNTTGKLPSNFTRGYEACRDAPCLYNVRDDPGEHVDVAAENAERVATMTKRFKELESDYHPPILPPPQDTKSFCKAVQSHGGFAAPYMPEE